MMLFIKKDVYDEMLIHSKTEYPKECCGILAGKGEKVFKIYKMENTSTDPINCYFIEPKEQIKVFKEMRNEGLELIGIYHSHVCTEPYPSKRDVELANYENAIYVIISLKNFEMPIGKAFFIKKETIEEVEIITAEKLFRRRKWIFM